MNVTLIKKVDGRINRSTGLKITTGLRVTAYCRVSTDGEDQKNSYESQKSYYKEKITSNPEWKYVEIYADEAISGTLDYKRNDFMRMIQDATVGKFDMIITKSISRFGRNTVDTLKYVRLLKEKGIAIYFEEERINTLEISGEIMLTVLSAMAQQESENISSHVKLGLQMKQKRGELIGYNGCLGYVYDKDTKEISINYEEAEIVRYIFERYCQGVGCTTIAKELTNMKYKTPTGKKKWHESTIRGILKNEKYKGDVLQGKTYTTDPISHRRVVNMGEENQYYIAEHHEPIISERMFNQAQEILQKRGGVRGSGRRKGNFSRKYPFSSRLYCGFCGSLLTRRNWNSGTKNSITVWHCMEFVKHGKENCPDCKAMKENIIEEAFTESYKLLCNNNKQIIQTFLNEMEEIIQEESNESSIKRLEEEKQILKEKIDKLIDLNLNGTINLETLQEKKAKLQNKINSIEKEQEHLQLELEDGISLNQGLNKFKTLFKDNEIMPEFDKDVFELMIEKVIIGEKEENGNVNPRLITFILKSGNEIKCGDSTTEKNSVVQNQENQQSSYEVSQNYLQPVCEPRGVLLGAISKELDKIAEFTAFENFISFEKKGKNKVKRVENNKIKVTIEVDMVCGVI